MTDQRSRDAPASAVKPHDYRDLIAAYIVANFGSRGIVVYTEVSLGKTIIGKSRKLDIFALRRSDQCALGIECKDQDSSGTTDEKIPYALQDLAAMWILERFSIALNAVAALDKPSEDVVGGDLPERVRHGVVTVRARTS